MNTPAMKWLKLPVLLLGLAALVASPAAHAQEDEDDFQPRTSAPPANRTGGASRTASSSGSPPPNVSILAPATTAGLTTREQPAVYWYCSADTEHPVVFSITDPAKQDESAEVTLKGPTKAGVHKIEFSSIQQDGEPVKLKPGVKYEFVVEVLVKKGTGASENPAATCRVVRLDPREAASLAAVAKEPDPAKRASAYAKEGVWFDYIDALNAAIAKTPDDAALLRRRARALAAQGLTWNPDGTISEKNVRPAGARQ